MEKKITTLNLRKDILDHARSTGVNLSEFVNESYFKAHLGIVSKIEEMGACEARIADLREEVRRARDRLESIKERQPAEARGFLSNVPRMLKEGKGLLALWRRYKVLYGFDVTLEEFEWLVDNQ